MEEIDMDMSKIYDAMDVGFEMINKEAAEKQIKINKQKEFELFLQDHLIRLIPEPLLPWIKLVDLYYPENRSYKEMQKEMIGNGKYGGWFKVKIPDIALISFHITMCNEISFWIFNPLMSFDDIDDSKYWSIDSIHENVKDYRLALALAKQVWDYYLKTEYPKGNASAGESHPEAEVYEPLDGEGGTFEIDEGYVQLMIDKRLKHYGLI